MDYYPKLSREEERELFQRARKLLARTGPNGKEYLAIRDRVILAHTGYAKQVAARWARKKSCEFDDMFQEAMAGMILCFPRFSPDRGTRFMSYSRYYINLFCRDFARMSANSLSVSRDVFTLANRCRALLFDNDQITPEQACREVLRKAKHGLRNVRPETLLAAVAMERKGLHTNALPDPGEGPCDKAERKDLHEWLQKSVSRLQKRMKKIILLRLSGKTFKEIGRIVGVSTQYVYMDYTIAEEKLRGMVT